MPVADLQTGEVRRLFNGVTDDGIEGVACTPDRRTLFVKTQHPAHGDPATTHFPPAPGSGRIPRDTTLVITRRDGGIVGS